MNRETEVLVRLIDASSILVSSLDLGDILPRGMETIKTLLRCEAASIMLLDEANRRLVFEVALGDKSEAVKKITVPLGEGVAGKVALDGEPRIVNDVTHEAFTASVDQRSGFTTKCVLCVPLMMKGRIIGVAEAINPMGKTAFNEADGYLLSLFANQVAMVVEASRMHIQIVARRRMEDELDFARQVQESFLPHEFPSGDIFSFHGFSRAAREVGGDFYDIFPLDERRIGFTIGDVSGKGVPAALFMAKVLGQLRFLAQKHRDEGGPSLVLKELNSSLAERHSENMFVTLIYGVFHSDQRKAVIASAGHPYPFVFRSAKLAWEQKIVTNGLPVGVAPEAEYYDTGLELSGGDMILMVTDGVLEADRDFNEKKILMILTDIYSAYRGQKMIAESLIKDFSRFINKHNPSDDFTMLALSGK